MEYRLILLLLLFSGCATAAKETVAVPSAIPNQDRAVVVRNNAHGCMALAMYWEARGEGARGMLAVGSVVRNRVKSADFPDSVCAVVKQGGERPPCQFSWWCDGKSDRPRNSVQWHKAQTLAGQIIAGEHRDITEGALFFHTTGIARPWDRPLTKRIGNHLFYR